MPGDPKQCREHAKRCWALASQTTNPVLKESLTDAAQRWAVLATELETIHSLLEAIEETEKKVWARQRPALSTPQDAAPGWRMEQTRSPG
jgi:hypothetical protein